MTNVALLLKLLEEIEERHCSCQQQCGPTTCMIHSRVSRARLLLTKILVGAPCVHPET